MTRRMMCAHGWLTGPGPGECPVSGCPTPRAVAPRGRRTTVAPTPLPARRPRTRPSLWRRTLRRLGL